MPEPRDRLLPSTRAAAFSLGAVLLTGLLLRFLVSPWAPAHANNHGIQEIRVLLDNSLEAVGRSGPYGDTFFVVMNTLLRIFGRTDRVLFGLNALFGTLALSGLYLLAKALRFSERGALFAALLFCLSPSQVWLAGTESQMALHLCLGLTGLALLLSSLRAKSAPGLWTASILVSVASALHVITIPFFFAALAVVLSEGAARAAWEDRGFRRHAALCLALAAVAVCLQARAIDDDALLRGLGEFDLPRRLAQWFGASNALWDPTLTPVAVFPLALLGGLALLRRRPATARSLALAAALLIPLSFSVDACRTDVLRYQTPTHWLYYLLAGFLFSEKPSPRGNALFAAACLLVLVTALPGLRLLTAGDEETREYRFMREVAAAAGPTSFLWLPARSATGLNRTEFASYVNGLPLLRGDEPDPFDEREGRLAYLGLDCYRLIGGEDPGGTFDAATGLRKECVAACALSKTPLLETTLDAAPPREGFQKRFWPLSRERPLVGLYRCRPRPAVE